MYIIGMHTCIYKDAVIIAIHTLITMSTLTDTLNQFDINEIRIPPANNSILSVHLGVTIEKFATHLRSKYDSFFKQDSTAQIADGAPL